MCIEVDFLFVEDKRGALAKLFSYTVLFIAPTCFGHSFDHLQDVMSTACILIVRQPEDGHKGDRNMSV